LLRWAETSPLLTKKNMFKKSICWALLSCLPLVQAQTDTGASALSEQDYLSDMPIVLSVSRLAQRLDETPGAVTILDRQFIRRSGARDVVDLLRLVPGFQTTTSFETDASMATYHGRADDFANRIQVLVDGRSVYSGFLQGSAGLGWQTLAMDDIERIEVLRGSNSATYGSRAFLGVVNIISRDVRETTGAAGHVNAGENGIADLGARVGWGDQQQVTRISVDSRGDNGLRKVFPDGKTAGDDNRVSRVNVLSRLTLPDQSDLDIRIGALEVAAIRGTSGGEDSEGNLERKRFMSSQYLQLDWRRVLSPDEDVAISASRTRHINNDSFAYLGDGFGPAYVGVPISFQADEYSDVASVQHTIRHSPNLRTVWGAELRREQIKSPSSFDAREVVTSEFARLFGNAELRASKNVVINAGVMLEDSNIGGQTAAPRLMVNWHVTPEQTFRAGVSNAFRPPSAFEKYADVRYYDMSGANPVSNIRTNGNVHSEKIESTELGYYLNSPRLGLTADVRAFNERIVDGIGSTPTDYSEPAMYANGDNATITGLEYQLSWKPTSSSQFFLNQTWTDIQVSALAFPNMDVYAIANTTRKITNGAPKYAASVTWMQSLPGGVELSLMHQRAEEMALLSENQLLYSMGRTDLRIAKAWRVGMSKVEWAFTVQNLDVPYLDGDKKFYFDRRAMVTLRIEN
jgi:iron complex outermembrane receptor protein